MDCWRLVRAVYASKGIDLPTYDHIGHAEREEVSMLVRRESAAWPWQNVKRGDERDFDVLIFTIPGQDHIGVVVQRGRMLHICEGQLSCVERYDNGTWKHRLAGIFRHQALD